MSEANKLWWSELDFVCLWSCVVADVRQFLWPEFFTASAVMLHGVIGCFVTDVSSDRMCSIFNSKVALRYLDP